MVKKKIIMPVKEMISQENARDLLMDCEMTRNVIDSSFPYSIKVYIDRKEHFFVSLYSFHKVKGVAREKFISSDMKKIDVFNALDLYPFMDSLAKYPVINIYMLLLTDEEIEEKWNN